jgi:hypothetical protein
MLRRAVRQALQGARPSAVAAGPVRRFGGPSRPAPSAASCAPPTGAPLSQRGGSPQAHTTRTRPTRTTSSRTPASRCRRRPPASTRCPRSSAPACGEPQPSPAARARRWRCPPARRAGGGHTTHPSGGRRPCRFWVFYRFYHDWDHKVVGHPTSSSSSRQQRLLPAACRLMPVVVFARLPACLHWAAHLQRGQTVALRREGVVGSAERTPPPHRLPLLRLRSAVRPGVRF